MFPRFLSLALLLVIFAPPLPAQAEIYAYVDKRGVRHYTNMPGPNRKMVLRTDIQKTKRPTFGVSPKDQLAGTILRHSRDRSVLRSGTSGKSKYSYSHGARARNRALARGNKLPATPHGLNRHIYAAARTHKIDPMLIKAVIHAESSFNPYALSPKGAQGLMQLMPGTAHDLQVRDAFDPRQNIHGGTKYLRHLMDSYNGNLELTLAAYNAGPGNVAKYGNRVPRFRETQNYVAKVMGYYKGYSRRPPSPAEMNSARNTVKARIKESNQIKVRQLVTVH